LRRVGPRDNTPAMTRGWFWLVLLGAGCAANPARVEREIFGRQSFAISNSPMLAAPREPRIDKGHVAIRYSFLIESFAAYPQSVALGGARASIAGRRPKVVCQVSGHAFEELLLEPGGRYRVDCDLGFTLGEVPLKAIGDAAARITIPMTLNGVSDETTFAYYFRREDAS
jgi:hypothetical protein